MGCPEQIRPCLACGNCMATTFSNGSPTCAVNPLSMKEGIFAITRAVQEKKVAVIGGGVGGMEAARIAAIRGHKVDLYESDNELGGRLFDAGIHAFKESVRKLNKWYKLQINDLGIKVHLNTVMDVEKIKALDVDTVILAVGSEPLMPRTIQGIDSAKATSCVDVLTGKRNAGERVIIVGGGLVGAEMAYEYSLEGKKVTLIEALDSLMANDPNGIPYWVRDMLVQLLETNGCDIRTGCRLERITGKGAMILNKDGANIEMEADDIVIAIGFKARPSIEDKLRNCGKDVYEIVAGNGIGNIATQVSSAYEITRHL
jgi:2-enoate reductase